jgi:gliding motility-associated-like protein
VIDASTGEVDLNTSIPGTYTVENFIAAGGGCVAATGISSITITAQDDAAFDYNGITTFCESDANPLANITGTAGGAFSSSPAGMTIDGTTGEIDLTATTSGVSYDVTYTTGGTCPDNSLVSVTINGSPTAPTTGTTAGSNTICEGASADITASGSTGTGVTYAVFDAATGGTNLGATPLTVNPTTTTTYYVESFNSNGCGNIGGRQVVTVTVNPTPSIDAGLDETICPGDNVTLTAIGTGSVVWSSTETTPSITVSPSVTTTYTVTLTDGNTCTNTDDVIVTVVTNGGTLVALDDAFTVETDDLTNFDILSNDTYGGNTSSIVLMPNNGTATSDINGNIDYQSNQGFIGVDSLMYEICDITCTNICDTATVIITVEKTIDFRVPGGFSPNGDNINDIFVIQGLDEYPDNNLSIFNRWGSIIFQAAPYNNDWGGNATEGMVLSGDKVTSGTYFYILELGDGVEPLKGSIEIKRD